MESDEIGNDLVRLDNGYLVDEENNIRCEYVVNSDDVLGMYSRAVYYLLSSHNSYVLLHLGFLTILRRTIKKNTKKNIHFCFVANNLISILSEISELLCYHRVHSVWFHKSFF